MGFNTTVVIYNDALNEIEGDPFFGKRLASAVREAVGGKPIYFFAATPNSSSSAGVVVETHHADHDVLVSVGGNTGKVIKKVKK